MFNGYNPIKKLANYNVPQSSSAFLRNLYKLPKPNYYKTSNNFNMDKIHNSNEYQQNNGSFRDAYRKMLLRAAAEKLRNYYGRTNGFY
ncbi:MAG: hypothetical protein BWY74_00146 [Firmicutes bacterium ADurb.Bin419]|nr:MAG: hypothetical protein BWY74_00146 [Firmicutes bacterium ADurb.Bin419]